MADDNEDQWLYGDSAEGKEYAPTNISSESQNDSASAKLQEKSQVPEDQKGEGVNETPSEVRASHNLLEAFVIKHFSANDFAEMRLSRRQINFAVSTHTRSSLLHTVFFVVVCTHLLR